MAEANCTLGRISVVYSSVRKCAGACLRLRFRKPRERFAEARIWLM